jgi:hypothetical protein
MTTASGTPAYLSSETAVWRKLWKPKSNPSRFPTAANPPAPVIAGLAQAGGDKQLAKLIGERSDSSILSGNDLKGA